LELGINDFVQKSMSPYAHSPSDSLSTNFGTLALTAEEKVRPKKEKLEKLETLKL
jgi:hypothetical protein